MLTGFEDITPELSDDEKEIAELVAKGLKVRVGREKAISNRKMREKIAEKNVKVGDAKMRKVVQYIRIEGLVPLLVASNEGYYVAKDEEEVRGHYRSLKQRARAISKLAENLRFQSGMEFT